MHRLEAAIALAVQVHAGQKDRYGDPYILHPLRVMCAMDTEAGRMAAVLHDVLEDSPLTTDDLRARGFPPEVVAAVDCLTRRNGEPYELLIGRAASDTIATRVKLADLEDNMDLRRLPEVTPGDVERLERYRAAWHRLNAVLHGGAA